MIPGPSSFHDYSKTHARPDPLARRPRPQLFTTSRHLHPDNMTSIASSFSDRSDAELEQTLVALREAFSVHERQEREARMRARETERAIVEVLQIQQARRLAQGKSLNWAILLRWDPMEGVSPHLARALATFDMRATGGVYDGSGQVLVALRLTAGDEVQRKKLVTGVGQMAPHMRPPHFEIERENAKRRDRAWLRCLEGGKVQVSHHGKAVDFPDLDAALSYAQRELPWRAVIEA